MLRLSTTAYSEAARCLKLYKYRRVDNLVRKPRLIGAPLRRGIWLHSCIEECHHGRGWGPILDELESQARDMGVEDEKIAKLSAEVRTIMTGYVDYWQTHDDGLNWTMTATEQEYTAQVGPDTTLSATLDNLALSRIYNTVGIVETKTTNEIPPPQWRAVDPQTAIQYFTALKNGVKVDWIMFDYLLTTPAAIPQVTKAGRFYQKEYHTTSDAFDIAAAEVRKIWPEPGSDNYIEQARVNMVNDDRFYQRHFVLRPFEHIKQTLQDVAAVRELIRYCEQTGHWPRSYHPLTCRKFCAYGDLCMLEYSLGREAKGVRDADFDIDDGTREGDTAKQRLMIRELLGEFGVEYEP